MAGSMKGWRRDPLGRHEFRYFSSDGRATRLVSDCGVRSYDSPQGVGEQTFGPLQPEQTPQVLGTPLPLATNDSPLPVSGGPSSATSKGKKRAHQSLRARVSGVARTFFRNGWRKPVIGLTVCGLLAFGAEFATASTSTATLQQGVYVGHADPGSVASFAAATQTDPTIASDYLSSTTGWDGMDGSGGELTPMLANGWSGSSYTLSLGVPMIPNYPNGGGPAGTLANGAAGLYDNYFVALGENLVAAGEADAYLRLGWDFDSGANNWSATNPTDEANFAAYFRQIVESMRSIPGEEFKFVWNPDAAAFGGEPGYDVQLAYPGSAYVDDIGVDAYDQTWVTPQNPDSEWYRTTLPELTAAATFAQNEDEPLAIPEWGVAIRDDGHGLGDDPFYVNRMIGWMQNPGNNVAYESYYDVNTTSQQDEITDGNFPASLAAFTSDLAATQPPTSTTTTTTAPSTTTTTTAPPTSTTTTTAPPTTTTTSTAPPAGGNCTSPTFSTSDAEGTDNTDPTDGNQYWWVDNDAWDGSAGPQTMNVCNQSSWYATSDQTDNQGQVETYPDTEYDVGGRNASTYPSTVPLSAYSSITSTFSEDFPTTGDSFDAAYDLWTDNWTNETMIWNQYGGTQDYWVQCAEPGADQNDCGDYVGAVTLDGVSYHVLNLGGEIIFVRDVQVSSGSVDILGAYNYEISQGLAKATDAPTQLEYGIEIVSTTGTQTFPLTGLTFSLSS
jgi:hypothetical protein